MAQAKTNKTRSTPSNSKHISKYLFVYNFVQLLGWSYITYLFINFYLTQQYRNKKLWNHMFIPVAFFQTLAILEIFHVVFGYVKTSVMMTTMQILFRIVNTFGVFNLIPSHINTIGVPMTLCAWCGAEVTRYYFHIFKELNYMPYFVLWLRYSAFIILIPIGVGGELLGQFIIQSLYQNKWNMLLPYFNITVGYRHFIIVMMISTAQGIFMMYRHLFTQRRKALGGTPGTVSRQKIKK